MKSHKCEEKNIVKVCQKYEKVPVLPVLHFKVKLLRRFQKILPAQVVVCPCVLKTLPEIQYIFCNNSSTLNSNTYIVQTFIIQILCRHLQYTYSTNSYNSTVIYNTDTVYKAIIQIKYKLSIIDTVETSTIQIQFRQLIHPKWSSGDYSNRTAGEENTFRDYF